MVSQENEIGKIDEAEVRRFVRFARPERSLLMILYIQASGGEPVARRFVVPDETDELVEFVRENNAKKRNCYWLPNGTAPEVSKKPAKADMLRARYAWADCDPAAGAGYPASRAHLLGPHAAKLAPLASFVIDSGNGLQAFFRLTEPITIAGATDEYERVNAAIGRHFEGAGTFNCDRIMRVAGTWNWPTPSKLKKGYPSTPSMSRVLSSSGRDYSIAELEALAPPDIGRDAPASAGDAAAGEIDFRHRFEMLLKTKPKMRARWGGSSGDLEGDTSGSAMDMSMGAMLKRNRFTLEEVRAVLEPWPHGSVAGRAEGDRYWNRLFGRTVAQPKPVTADESAVIELNRRHAYVLLGSSGAVLKETDGPFDFLKLDAFRAYYANQMVEVATLDAKGNDAKKWMPIADVWMRSPARRTYDGVEFAPAGARPGYYNLWRGFAVEPLAGLGVFRSGLRCRRLLSHIKFNVCQGDRVRFRYFVRWCADMVQRPDDKPGVAVSIAGEKGTGKTKVVEALSALLGSHAMSVSQPEQLLGRFNGHHAQALLIAAEESFWAGDKKAEGALKHMVTSATLMLEKKGVDAITMASLTRYMFVGNADWLFPATADERRLFALTCGGRRRRDYSYFKAIDDQLYGTGKRKHCPGQGSPGLRALLTFLQAVDLTGYEIRDIPETEALRAQRAATLEPHDQFFLDCLNNQEIDGAPWDETGMRITKQRLYQAYTDAMRARGRGYSASQEQFAKRVRKAFAWRDVRTASEPRQWRVTGWSEARAFFENSMKISIDDVASIAKGEVASWLSKMQEKTYSQDFAVCNDGTDLV